MNKIIKICFYCLIMLFITANAGVQSEIDTIITENSLRLFYNSCDIYKKRYIVKDLPNWLDTRGISVIPVWVYNALDDALNSYRPMFIREAAIVAGKFGYNDFTRRMADVYLSAQRWFPADADRVRLGILESLLTIGGVDADTLIPELFLNAPRNLLSSEFGLLLIALDEYGDSSCVLGLKAIEDEIYGVLRNSGYDPAGFGSKYKLLLGHVSDLRRKLEGGEDD